MQEASILKEATLNEESGDGNVTMFLRNEDRETFPDVKWVAERGPKNE